MRINGNDSTTIWIYGAIGDMFGPDAVTDKSVRDALDKASGASAIKVRVNSPGGVVDDSIAIHTLLREHPARKVVSIDGIAASAASIVAMAGDSIEMAAGSKLMVHHPWSMVVGNYKEMRAAANVAEKYSQSAAGMYAARSGRSIAEVTAAMDAETYFLADEAVQFGLADSVTDSRAIAAHSIEQTISHARKVAALAFAALVGEAPQKQKKIINSLQWAALELARARSRRAGPRILPPH